MSDNSLLVLYNKLKQDGYIGSNVSFDEYVKRIKQRPDLMSSANRYAYKNGITKEANANKWFSTSYTSYNEELKKKQASIDSQKNAEINAQANLVKQEEIKVEKKRQEELAKQTTQDSYDLETQSKINEWSDPFTQQKYEEVKKAPSIVPSTVPSTTPSETKKVVNITEEKKDVVDDSLFTAKNIRNTEEKVAKTINNKLALEGYKVIEQAWYGNQLRIESPDDINDYVEIWTNNVSDENAQREADQLNN